MLYYFGRKLDLLVALKNDSECPHLVLARKRMGVHEANNNRMRAVLFVGTLRGVGSS
jgi:hypothetical protein